MSLLYGPPEGSADIRSYAAIVAQTFAGDAATYEEWTRAFGADGVRVLRDGDVKAGLVVYRMGQFFGGRSVPTWGVAAVAVAPEARGHGYGKELMRQNLREAAQQGVALSTLYPAAPGLYHALGWAFAGLRTTLRLRLGDLPAQPTDIELRPMGPDDEPIVRDLYRRRFATINGSLDRDELIWARVRRAPAETPVTGYIAHRGSEPVGYTLFLQKREPPGIFPYNIHVRDLVCIAPGATEAFLAFFARHRSVAREVVVFAAPNDTLLRRTQVTQEVPGESQLAWMLRVIRVKEALEGRGYSPAIGAEAVLQLQDDELPDSSGPWTLHLAEGRMSAERGGSGGPNITAGGLAALYSGFHTPAQLRESGQLTGDAAHDAALQAMFAGPLPWMPDFF